MKYIALQFEIDVELNEKFVVEQPVSVASSNKATALGPSQMETCPIDGDIKPPNILIETHTQRPITTDFGLARLTRGPNQQSSKIQGVPTYMAPEQISNAPLDGRADVYAAGVMLFEMLVSHLPLPAYSNSRELLTMRLEPKDKFIPKKAPGDEPKGQSGDG